MNYLWKPVTEYYLRDTCKSLMWVASIYTAIMIAIMFLVGVIIVTPNENNTGFNTASELVLAITLMIVCMCYLNESIRFFLQHGISRQTAFIGFVLHLSIAGVIYAVTIILLSGLFSLLSGSGLETLLFWEIYYGWLGAVGTVPGFLVYFIWLWAMLLAAGAFGYFSTAVYNNLNNIGRILGVIGVIIILPMINRLTDGTIVQFGYWFFWLFRGPGDVINPFNGIGFFLVLSAILLGFSWLLVRRYKLN